MVIMAGGVGSRFLTMSTAERPKQFIDVLGTGRTLLQLTVERFGNLVPAENVWVVTSEAYKDIVVLVIIMIITKLCGFVKKNKFLKNIKQHGPQKIGNQTKKQEEKSLQKNSISSMSK